MHAAVPILFPMYVRYFHVSVNVPEAWKAYIAKKTRCAYILNLPDAYACVVTRTYNFSGECLSTGPTGRGRGGPYLSLQRKNDLQAQATESRKRPRERDVYVLRPYRYV